MSGWTAGTFYDTGTISVTVSDTTAQVNWVQGSTPSGLAATLAASINGLEGIPGSSCPTAAQIASATGYVSACASGGTVTLTSLSGGPAVDWAVTASAADTNPTYFSSSGPNNYQGPPSFAVTAANMSGGEISGSVLYSYAISDADGYAPNGNLLSVADSVTGTWSYAYDNLNRVVTAAASDGSYAGAQMSWSYDPFGNRTSESVGGSSSAPMPLPSTASYTASNQVSSVNGGAGLAYDAAGDVTQDPLNSYLYDAEGRLCAAKTAGPSYTGYIYDAGGTRVAKGSLTNFTCDFNPSDSAYNHFAATASYVLGPSGEQVTEYSTSGLTNTGTQCTSTTATCWKHTNAFAVGQLLATYTGTDTIFALKDWLGSKRVEVGASGCATAFSGLAYGDGLTPVSLPGYASCIDATEQHFTGKERDAESGNDYFEARYYSSTMGRFMSPDWSAKIEPVPYAKMGDPQSLNLYAYVQNHPLSATDPDGHIENSWWQNASATYDPLASRWAAQQALQINTLILQQELAKLQNEVSNGGLGLSDKAVKLVEHIANIKTTIDSAKWYAYWNKLYTGHLYMYRFDGGSSRYADPGRIPLDLAHMKLDEAEMSYYGAKQVLEAGQVFGKMTPGMVESCLVVQRMQVHQAEYEYEQAFSEYTQTPVRQ